MNDKRQIKEKRLTLEYPVGDLIAFWPGKQSIICDLARTIGVLLTAGISDCHRIPTDGCHSSAFVQSDFCVSIPRRALIQVHFMHAEFQVFSL
jgi:hypothetical protein